MSCCEIGTYECSVFAFACKSCGHAVWVDKCLLDEILSLHDSGIDTLGCCCGHNERVGYIQVVPEHVGKMVDMGYMKQEPDGDMGLWCFEPKSECPKER